ncbi:hypothetical protein SeMB42_g01349 [Synchytrium endobioticum]|uniref:Uncharacterized protein n=1 Tax=Synchytrium endobioticum TaxID=286115 RepID=A0A507DE43_9FUNG|nr:hypothetical protein SeLEV6574_g01384 [Synchytrium endobioticum]TPX52509.1 hypothetical protein SeMB42_g01349 [Synchytrium endobioticum]
MKHSHRFHPGAKEQLIQGHPTSGQKPWHDSGIMMSLKQRNNHRYQVVGRPKSTIRRDHFLKDRRTYVLRMTV